MPVCPARVAANSGHLQRSPFQGGLKPGSLLLRPPPLPRRIFADAVTFGLPPPRSPWRVGELSFGSRLNLTSRKDQWPDMETCVIVRINVTRPWSAAFTTYYWILGLIGDVTISR
jgi:hypothetical protein